MDRPHAAEGENPTLTNPDLLGRVGKLYRFAFVAVPRGSKRFRASAYALKGLCALVGIPLFVYLLGILLSVLLAALLLTGVVAGIIGVGPVADPLSFATSSLAAVGLRNVSMALAYTLPAALGAAIFLNATNRTYLFWINRRPVAAPRARAIGALVLAFLVLAVSLWAGGVLDIGTEASVAPFVAGVATVVAGAILAGLLVALPRPRDIGEHGLVSFQRAGGG